MNLLTILVLALSLAMDAFAVSISAGLLLPKLSFRAVFRLAWHFGFFQFLMPILGWLAGLSVRGWIEPYDHWIAFGLLGFIGGKMIYESFQMKTFSRQNDPTRGWNLILLSLATSIDALAVGLSMALVGIRIWLPCIIIGVIAGLMTILGMFLGRRLGRLLGGKMEFIGGLLLIGIGLKILLKHLLSAPVGLPT